mmetsp:Transcript_20411/g.62059  ORF Transcript_20411/g.62059 Transcript_20411/m.62059 type:complete len:236 (+) Transcript_20411:6693-7400(+)
MLTVRCVSEHLTAHPHPHAYARHAHPHSRHAHTHATPTHPRRHAHTLTVTPRTVCLPRRHAYAHTRLPKGSVPSRPSLPVHKPGTTAGVGAYSLPTEASCVSSSFTALEIICSSLAPCCSADGDSEDDLDSPWSSTGSSGSSTSPVPSLLQPLLRKPIMTSSTSIGGRLIFPDESCLKTFPMANCRRLVLSPFVGLTGLLLPESDFGECKPIVPIDPSLILDISRLSISSCMCVR